MKKILIMIAKSILIYNEVIIVFVLTKKRLRELEISIRLKYGLDAFSNILQVYDGDRFYLYISIDVGKEKTEFKAPICLFHSDFTEVSLFTISGYNNLISYLWKMQEKGCSFETEVDFLGKGVL